MQRHRTLRLVGSVVGLLLFAAAVAVAVRQWDQVSGALAHAARAKAWIIALLLVCPLLSWTFTSLMFDALLNPGAGAKRVRRVGLGEMHAVIAATWLLNYLPSRMGMFGRVAYHTIVNKIPLRETVTASIAGIACGVLGVLLLVGAALIAHTLGSGVGVTIIAVVAPAALLTIAPLAARRSPAPAALRDLAARFAWAALFRYLDVLVWLARYALAFAALARPLSLLEAAALTAVSQAAMMLPLVSNGLGVREWAVALLGPALPAWARSGAELSRPLAISADLLHRAADVVVALPVGLAGAAIITRRLKRAAAAGSGSGSAAASGGAEAVSTPDAPNPSSG